MADTVHSDYQALQDVAGKFQQEADNIDKIRQSLQNQADGLVGKDWIGNGANAFRQRLEDAYWPTFGKLSKAMSQTGDVLQKCAKAFNDAEQQGKSGVTKITITFG